MKFLAVLAAFCFSLSAHAQFSAKAKADLRARCKKNDAKSCGYLGAMEWDKNRDEALKYHHRSCTLGNSSSCVFVGMTPRKAGAPAALAPTAVANTGMSEMERWIQDKMGHLLVALIDTTPGQTASHFSVDQCRVPLTEYLKLAMEVKKSLSHTFKFGPGCDLDGSYTIQLNVPIFFDFRSRNLDEVVRVTGEADLKIEKVNATQFKQTSRIYNAAAYDANSNVVARFATTHEQTVNVDMSVPTATVFSNAGMARLYEFRGKQVSEERPYHLDNIIKQMVLQRRN